MYARQVDDQVLTFSVSGMLWERSLVMLDRETESLWGHLLGSCMRGPLKGKQLKVLASELTTWASWRERHPDTTILALGPVRTYNLDKYENPSEFVLGVSEGKSARAWTFKQLIATPLINDQFIDEPIVVAFDSKTFTGRIFARGVQDQVLTFHRADDTVQDEETESTWDFGSGVAVRGPLTGQRLRQIPAFTSYIHAWNTFHPDSAYWQSND